SKDRETLDVAIGVLDTHLEDLARVAPDADTSLYQQSRRRLDTARATLDDPASEPPPPEADDDPKTRPARTRRVGSEPSSTEAIDEGERPVAAGDDAARRRRRLTLGVGLGIGGAVAVTGIAFLGYRGSFVRRTEQDYDANRAACEALSQPTDPNAPGPCDATEAWYAGEQDKIRTHLVVGSVLLAAGAAAMVATGVVVLVRDKRGRTTARIGASPFASGFALTGRF